MSAVSLLTTRNIIKDNERTKHFLIKIYLSFYSRKGPQFVVSLRNRWRDIYSERGLLLVPYLFPGARGCQRLHPLASRIVGDDLTPLIDCVSKAWLPNSLPRSKSDHVVITWSPSGYISVGPDSSDALPSSCLLITTWQLVKAHGVTRNEPEIYVICYITDIVWVRWMRIRRGKEDARL